MNIPCKRALSLLLVCALGGVLAAGATTGCRGPDSSVQTVPPPRTALPAYEAPGVAIDWAFVLNSLSDLCAYAETIIIGTVVRPSSGPEPGGHMGNYTRWDIRVDECFKGNPGSTVVTFGTADQAEASMNWDLALIPGDRYLLFLREVEPGLFSAYLPIGKYLIFEDRVYSMNHLITMESLSNTFPGVDMNGLDITQVVSQIRAETDSVELILTLRPDIPVRVIRSDAGATIDLEATIYTGQCQGNVVYSVSGSFPQALVVTVEPDRFQADPRTSYHSRLAIVTLPDLRPDAYRITLQYRIGDGEGGERSVTLYVNPYVPNSLQEG